MDEQSIRITLNAMMAAFKRTTESCELTVEALTHLLPEFEKEFRLLEEEREKQRRIRPLSSTGPQTVGDASDELVRLLVRLLAKSSS